MLGRNMKLGLKFALMGAVAAVGYAGYIFWCYSQSPFITVANRSDKTLEDVILAGSGFSQRFDKLSPHETISCTVHPRGESSLQISFISDSVAVVKNDLAYLESAGGYRADILIDSDMNISCKNYLR